MSTLTKIMMGVTGVGLLVTIGLAVRDHIVGEEECTECGEECCCGEACETCELMDIPG